LKHGTDLFDLYEGNPIEVAVINFVNHLDLNGDSGDEWPQYSLQNPKNLAFGPGGTFPRAPTYWEVEA
jgi:acetylcholinesterase